MTPEELDAIIEANGSPLVRMAHLTVRGVELSGNPERRTELWDLLRAFTARHLAQLLGQQPNNRRN